MIRQKVVILVALLALLVGLLSVSVSASVNPDYNIPLGDPSASTAVIGSYSNGNYVTVGVSSTLVSGNPCVGCFYGSSASDYSFIFLSTHDTGQGGYFSVKNSSGSWIRWLSSPVGSSQSTVVDGVTYYYTIRPSSSIDLSGVTVSWPVVSDLSSAISACVSALNYSPVVLSNFSFDLTAGNIAVIETSSTPTDVYMSATMPDLSKTWIAGPEPDYWPDDLVTYGYVSSAPVAGSSLPSLSGYISWDRGSDRNLLGQTQSALKNLTFDLDNNAQYLVIYNYPYYPFSGNNSSSAPTIHFDVEDAVRVVVYSGTVTASGTTLGEIVYTRTPEGSWEDSDGGNSAPPPGGGNYIPSDGDLFSVLTDLVSDIDSFFTGTWQYIRNIVDSLSGFPAFVVQLYSWLPQEFRVVIFSAFNIVVMIGVLKVML